MTTGSYPLPTFTPCSGCLPAVIPGLLQRYPGYLYYRFPFSWLFVRLLPTIVMPFIYDYYPIPYDSRVLPLRWITLLL